MPTPPELGYVTREIGMSEVSHKANTEQLRASDGDVRIAGKIAVDLEGETNDPAKDGNAGRILGLQCRIGDDRTCIGDGDLLEESPQHLSASGNSRRIIEPPRRKELGQKVRRSLNRPRNQLREETDESKERDRVLRRPDRPAIDIERVTQRLEGVKGNADGKDEGEGRGMRNEGRRKDQLRTGHERIDKEIVVLENTEDAKIDDQGERDIRLRPRHQPKNIRPRACERDQNQEPPVPPTVEHIARHEQQNVLRPPFTHKPIGREYDR